MKQLGFLFNFMNSVKDKQKEQSCSNTPNLDSLQVKLQSNDRQNNDSRLHQKQSGKVSRLSRAISSNKTHRTQHNDKNQNKQEQNKDNQDKKSLGENKQSQDVQIRRITLKPTKNNSTLIRKYRHRTKNTSRNDQMSYISSNSHSKNKQFSSVKNDNESQRTQNERDDISTNYKEQNKRLKNKSQFLMQQLRKLQAKLNKQLTKRGSPKKKQRAFSLQNISNRQILNADKRCKIYQRDIEVLKHKASLYNEQKVNQLKDQIKKLKQQKQQMNTDRKQLKKQVKKYQKIVEQIGDGDYLRLKQKNESLKCQNSKLKLKVKKQQQQQRIQKLTVSNSKAKNKKQQQKLSKEKKKQEQKQQKQINILKSKSQRDDKKIKSLIYENNNNKQKIQQLRSQLKEKNKQIQTLKDRLAKYTRLQKKKKDLQNRKNKEQEDKKINQKQTNKLSPRVSSKSKSIQKQKSRQYQQLQQRSETNFKSKTRSRSRSKSKQKSQSKSNQKRDLSCSQQIQPNQFKKQKRQLQKETSSKKKQNKKEQNKPRRGYPKKLQKGQSNTESYKWNHHPYSSKIKQIQVMPHSNGHIKCLNFRYEKGEPSRIQKGNYASFVCDQNNDEYIRQVDGGFKAGNLQYIKVITNKKREAVFCKYQIAQQCNNFSFGYEQDEYPCAFFGENHNQSVIRIGCFVQLLKNKQKKQ